MSESPKSEKLSDTSESENNSPKVSNGVIMKLKRLSSENHKNIWQVKKQKKQVEKVEEKPAKALKRKAENSDSLKALTDDEGNEYFDIGRSRRVAISDFKGKKFLNIREYYQNKNGEMAPGKKGITLNKSEWENLLSLADQIKFPEE